MENIAEVIVDFLVKKLIHQDKYLILARLQ